MSEQRYRVIDRLEAGGMAEVFRGEAASVQGFKKQVAIKRVLPHLAQNKNFIAMFLDEARLGARLNHANIVTVFDIGAADNTYFLVMEYVDGGNLKAVMEAIRRQGRRFPMKEAIYICMEACRGLSYAHEITDDDGEPLHIVHRDVSPPNIMLSKRGEVKMTDFGLAKATTQLEKTDPGVVKGKFSYLSPEAAYGQEVDARADVFALGIVLWEMLAGRRLFLGETDYQTVKLVQQANVPSLSRLNPEVDTEFEGVLGRALARDPNERYQSAREFGDALAGFLFSHQMKVTSYDIGTLAKSCLAQHVPMGSQEQSIIDRLIQEELLRFTSLDDMTDPLVPGATPLSPDEVDGARPLDAGAFENPADWFSDDADVAAAFDDARGDRSVPGWLEAGIDTPPPSGDLANLLEADEGTNPVMPRPRMPTPAAPSGPPSSGARFSGAPPSGTPRARTSSAAPLPPSRASERPAAAAKSGAWKFVLFAVVVLAAAGGAAAWFTGVIPR